MTAHPDQNTATGIAGAMGAVSIWAFWIILTRLSVTTEFTPGDIVFLRYSIIAIFTLPLLWHRRGQLRRAKAGHYAVMILGAGAPYMLVAATSMQHAPVAHIGVLMPGTMPLFVALFSMLLYGERLSRWRLAGLGIIICGDIAVGGFSIFHILANDLGHAWVGYLLMLLAAALWAGFTIAQRRSGLDPWMATAVIGMGSFLGFAPYYLAADGLAVFGRPLAAIAFHGLYQGVGAGILALGAFNIAIQHLGPQRAATFSSLVPALAALLAIPLLGEFPDLVACAGVALVTCGLLLATGAISPGRPADGGKP